LNVELLYDLSLIKEVPQFKIENSKFKITPAFLRPSLGVSLPFGLGGRPAHNHRAKREGTEAVPYEKRDTHAAYKLTAPLLTASRTRHNLITGDGGVAANHDVHQAVSPFNGPGAPRMKRQA
jgi:hypothetical protein